MGDELADCKRIAFLLGDRFPLFPFAAAIDTLRVANHLLDEEYYKWITASADGAASLASNDMPLAVDFAVSDLPDTDILFVCLGMVLDFPGKSNILAELRSRGRRGSILGGISAGTYLLAEAGLLDGYRCTIHWENRASFTEKYPRVECTGNVYTIDRNRYTCAGGTTSIDLMLEIIRDDLGSDLANSVANQLLHDRIRSTDDRQRSSLEPDLSGKSEKLQMIVREMTDHLDEPISVVDLAASAGLSMRQVERLFLRHLKVTPGRFYMRLRLERARELLRQTNFSILDIAIATGFTSHSYFAQSYRREFGRPPSEERRTAY